MAEVLHVDVRKDSGTRHARRLRAAGKIPAVLYGHGGANICLSVPYEQISSAVRYGGRLVELTGGVEDRALVRETQWDALGINLLHVDFTRVEVGESVETMVAIELRGEAPGARQGGIVEQHVHEIRIECPVVSIPERISVNINELELDQSLTADTLALPDGAKLLTEPSLTIVHCSVPAAAPVDEEISPAESVEPEVIGRKGDEEEGGAD